MPRCNVLFPHLFLVPVHFPPLLCSQRFGCQVQGQLPGSSLPMLELEHGNPDSRWGQSTLVLATLPITFCGVNLCMVLFNHILLFFARKYGGTYYVFTSRGLQSKWPTLVPSCTIIWILFGLYYVDVKTTNLQHLKISTQKFIAFKGSVATKHICINYGHKSIHIHTLATSCH